MGENCAAGAGRGHTCPSSCPHRQPPEHRGMGFVAVPQMAHRKESVPSPRGISQRVTFGPLVRCASPLYSDMPWWLCSEGGGKGIRGVGKEENGGGGGKG